MTEHTNSFDRVTYLVMGQYYWGHGDDLATAKRNFRAQGGVLSNGYAKLEFPQGISFAGVDMMGRYQWAYPNGEDNGITPDVTYVEPRKVKR